jgi:hypothetical protein
MYANSATGLKRLESGINNSAGIDAVLTTIGIEAGAVPKHLLHAKACVVHLDFGLCPFDFLIHLNQEPMLKCPIHLTRQNCP